MMVDWYCRRYKIPPADELIPDVDCYHSRMAVNLFTGLISEKEIKRLQKLEEDRLKQEEEMNKLSGMGGEY